MPWRQTPKFVAEHLHAAGSHDLTRPMLELLILTAARSGEVRGMRWFEVDLKEAIWTIPAERMKAKAVASYSAFTRAIEILKNQLGMHDDLVFPRLHAIKLNCQTWY